MGMGERDAGYTNEWEMRGNSQMNGGGGRTFLNDKCHSTYADVAGLILLEVDEGQDRSGLG